MNQKIPVACCHTVFTKEQRSAYKHIWDELEKRKIRTIEIEKGFEYQFPGDSDLLHMLSEWIILERKCCPFLKFTIHVMNENEPILLQMTGTEEVKAFLRNELDGKIQEIISVNGNSKI